MPEHHLQHEQHHLAVGCALATRPGTTAPAEVVDHFMAYLAAQGLQIDWCRILERGQTTAACLGVLSPGRTAMILASPVPPESALVAAQAEVLLEFVRLARSADVHMFQSLIGLNSPGVVATLQQAGFEFLARLQFLVGSAPLGRVLPQHGPDLETYGPANHDAFLSTLAATYEGSLDCPGLTGYRSLDDVLASHKASGLHDPQLWFLARDESVPVGVLLLTRVPLRPALEIVYVGVVPGSRGRGLGRYLVNLARQTTQRRGCGHLMLAVDTRNRYAIDIYKRLGLVETECKEAWIRLCDAGA